MDHPEILFTIRQARSAIIFKLLNNYYKTDNLNHTFFFTGVIWDLNRFLLAF
jgi:hypothetical protein